MDRSDCYSLASGHGLEIGPLHEPAQLPENSSVEYFDLRSKADSATIFDELNPDTIVEVDHIGDIDKRDLRRLGQDRFDFVLASHVIEHLANPIALIEDAFHILKPNGLLIIAAPDKRFTFDKAREITSTQHCLHDYKNRVETACDSHYTDFIRNVLPDGPLLHGNDLEERRRLVRIRREHVHVWDSTAFKDLIDAAFLHLKIDADLVYEIDGDRTKFEYRAAFRKRPQTGLRKVASTFCKFFSHKKRSSS